MFAAPELMCSVLGRKVLLAIRTEGDHPNPQQVALQVELDTYLWVNEATEQEVREELRTVLPALAYALARLYQAANAAER